MKKVVLLISGFLIASSVWSQCADPGNMHHFIFNERSYLVVKELKIWTDAASCSQELGGNLVHINNADEQEAVYKSITDSAKVASDYVEIFNGGGIAYVWIGASDQHQEGQWIWDGDNDNEGELFWTGEGANGNNDGKVEEGAFAHWGGITLSSYNEPDNYGGSGQDHAAIGLSGWPAGSTALGSPGEWNDITGSSKIYFVVEYDSVIDASALLGIHSPVEAGKVKVYPNPASSLIHIEADQLEYIEILNLQGQLVQQSEQSPLHVDELSSGYYLLRIFTGQEIFIEKVLIE